MSKKRKSVFNNYNGINNLTSINNLTNQYETEFSEELFNQKYNELNNSHQEDTNEKRSWKIKGGR